MKSKMKPTKHFENESGNCDTCIKIGYDKAIKEVKQIINKLHKKAIDGLNPLYENGKGYNMGAFAVLEDLKKQIGNLNLKRKKLKCS